MVGNQKRYLYFLKYCKFIKCTQIYITNRLYSNWSDCQLIGENWAHWQVEIEPFDYQRNAPWEVLKHMYYYLMIWQIIPSVYTGSVREDIHAQSTEITCFHLWWSIFRHLRLQVIRNVKFRMRRFRFLSGKQYFHMFQIFRFMHFWK